MVLLCMIDEKAWYPQASHFSIIVKGWYHYTVSYFEALRGEAVQRPPDTTHATQWALLSAMDDLRATKTLTLGGALKFFSNELKDGSG